MNKNFRYAFQLPLAFLDLLLLNLTFVLGKSLLHERLAYDEVATYLTLLLALNLCWVLVGMGIRLYTESKITVFEDFTKSTAQAYLLWVIAILFYLFFLRKFGVSRYLVVFIFGGYAAGLIFNRFVYLGIYYHYKSRNFLRNRVMIIGYNDAAKKLENYFNEEGVNYNLVGFTENASNVTELTTRPILGAIQESVETARKHDVQEIFSTIMPEQDQGVYAMMYAAEKACIRFKIVPDFAYFINKPVHIRYFRDLPVLSLREEPLDDMGNRMKKRIMDVAVSLFVTVFILSWLVPLLGLLIKLESRGPIFFVQVRSGRNNNTFRCYKFRSMTVNKQADSHQATRNDARITRIGKFIRKTSLDEFPQFFNVLKGEMSLVGPRPHMVKHTTDYAKVVDQFMIRQFLKPGITGWAQINGYRGEIKDDTAIKMRVTNDLWYLENWNIWLDIRIMFLTIYKVFAGDEKAY
jgi:putative colanic acid biosynthesis UDP-glucose lipid carrier transferase